MIYYLLLSLFAIRSLQLLCKGRLVNTVGVNLSDGSYDSGSESAPFIATFPDPLAALGGIEDGNGADATSQIVTSGSNSDGEWVRLSSGLQICHSGRIKPFESTPGWAGVGSLYYTSLNDWTFPRAFDNNSSTSLIGMAGRTGADNLNRVVMIAGRVDAAATGTTQLVAIVADNAAYDFEYSLIAIGLY